MSSLRHSQVQPDAPKLSLSPLESLTHKVTDQHSVWDDHAHFILGIPAGVSACVYANYFNSRPLFSNIPRIFLVMGVFTAIIKYSRDLRMHRQGEEEAIAREYILKHPEDFPPYDRKQYKDILESWMPIR